MLSLSKKEFTEAVDRFEGKLLTEASGLGMGPGEWPDFIAVTDEKGEGVLFARGAKHPEAEGEGGYSYWTKGGVELVVFND